MHEGCSTDAVDAERDLLKPAKSTINKHGSSMLGLGVHIAPRRPKIWKCLEDKELNQARPKRDPADQPVRTARTTVHHYNGTQYCSTDAVIFIFLFIYTIIYTIFP